MIKNVKKEAKVQQRDAKPQGESERTRRIV
jgi:hypothetical protein